MRQRIIIQKRSISTDNITSDVDFEEEFEDVATVSAAVTTHNAYRSFNGVGLNTASNTGSSQGFTHKFYIRYLPDCIPTTENFVQWGCDKYRIIGVENLDGRNRYFSLSCVLRGTASLDANLA